ncbi:Malate synthase A [Halobacillus karajensis]|uniref:Malate synthase n=2 Tax=Halobacillus karajensis TaxID=195088 RepID=A0A059NXN4_9BACI|nr:Malate synthase A [Halobacillus karajensis]CDQ22536.1 Malate synthase A [Halobacillus karajensis]CDQ26018.1 Malate synthase A [Halobacillus karajensis]
METKLSGIQINGVMSPGFKEILTDEALEFLAHLHKRFNGQRKQLLKDRAEIQKRIDQGERPDFLEETKDIRNAEWTIAPIPEELEDRRVEITGPVDRKMVINGLNSGAKVFMADFEDANSPTWSNTINGQINLRDAIQKTIRFESNQGKVYQLNEETAVLKVRPRGWHLEEKHLSYNQEALSASLVDFGLYFFHNAQRLMENGSAPYFYLPKLENHQEAKLWNEVFIFAQDYLNIPKGTIKATVLIETILAAFEMDEILYELKDHSAGLNCGRWDYIFSYLKKFRNHKDFLLPDRSQVTMTVPFMRSYSLLTIQTCHKRNAPAIGGMAAQIPVKNDAEKNEQAFEKVRSDKEREVTDGHDGTWVAHPAMVETAMDIFDKYLPGDNQINKTKTPIAINADQLLEVPEGSITEQGLRTNINVGIQYIASWLDGKGAAPIHHLMEDAATAEISRAQVWQWIRHPQGTLEDGRNITMELYAALKEEEMEAIRWEVGKDAFEKGSYHQAAELFDRLIRNDEFAEFLTLEAYTYLT